jgi:MoaA/NifB/PqqE/SkfB family radical SAM enzyme
MTYIDPRTKALWHTDRLTALRETGKTAAPVNVEIDLSNRCDLKCAGCHFAYTHTRGPWASEAAKPEGAIPGGDLMPPDLALSILNQLHAAGVRSVTWTGGGEPTLHPAFDQITHHASLLGLEQGIYTHGGHINQARAAAMRQEFTWIYISFDACTPESYKARKGVDRFKRVRDNIRRLVETPGNATIGLGYLISGDNWRDIHDMIRLGRILGVDYVQFRPLILFEQATPTELIAETEWINRALSRLDAYRHDSFVVADPSRFLMYQKWTGHGYPTCYWSAMQTVITPNGKVWRCVNKREHPDALLGDLACEPFADIWQRAGGPCAVDASCRLMCRGHVANLTLDQIILEPVHANFI